MLLPGCSSTHIQSARHPAAAASTPFRNVVVVGMDERPDVRNGFENDAVAFLQERGVDGIASYTRFSFAEIKGDRQQLRQRLQAAGAASALFVSVTSRGDFVEGAPVTPGSMDMGAVDETRYLALTTPGGEVDTALRLGARLYRVSDGTVVWSGLVDTVVKEDYDSITVVRNLARTIVGGMAKDKVIP